MQGGGGVAGAAPSAKPAPAPAPAVKKACQLWGACIMPNCQLRHPCKYWAECKDLRNNLYNPARAHHFLVFCHPCPQASQCSRMYDAAHALEFSHPCPQGPRCQLQNDPAHQQTHMHLCAEADTCGRRDLLEHKVLFEHVMSADNTGMAGVCPLGGDCTKMADEKHTFQYVHPCKYGKDCRLLKKPGHTDRFYHPPSTSACKHGDQCRGLLRGDRDHMDKFHHVCVYGMKCPKLVLRSHIARFLHETPAAAASAAGSVMSAFALFKEWPKAWTRDAKGNLEKGLVEVKSSSQEYQNIAAAFNSTAGNTITKIERNQNHQCYYLWYQTREAIAAERGGGDANVQEGMFHGTGTLVGYNAILDTGFDQRHANPGLVGCGIYFAHRAGYSVSYARSHQGTGSNKMFLAWVIEGDSVQGQSGQKTEPTKPDGTKYHSTTNVVNSGRDKHVIIFNNRQAYAAYVITYN